MTDRPPASTPLSPALKRPDSEIKKAFRALQTTADVADLLEVSESQLTHILWRVPERERYRTWQITKRRGGTREINAPCKSHMILQKKLLHALSLAMQQRSAVHGFVANRNIVTNANVHTKCRWVLNIDLKDFFPSINFGRVRGMLISKPYCIGERAATTIAHLCCHQNSLPQGAPTSPAISNMICARLDGELRRLADAHKCRYTRYADDITFSSNKITFPKELATLLGEGTKAAAGPALKQVIDSNGFEINPSKIRLQSRFMRQEVTGLIANRRPNVRREFLSQIRSMLHAWERYGYEAAQAEFLSKYDSKHRPRKHSSRIYERVIRGKIAFLKQVRGSEDSRYLSLSRRLDILTGSINPHRPTDEKMNFDVFICHASEDKTRVAIPLTTALENAGIRVWIDKEQIGWGDSVTGGINRGLAQSRFVILVISKAFMKKKWPAKEMNSTMSKEISSGVTCALPLLVGSAADKQAILQAYPLLCDKHYKEWAPSDIGVVVSSLKAMLARYESSSTDLGA